MANNKPAQNYKVKAGLVAALGGTYLWQIGLLVTVVVLVLIVRDK